MEAMFKVKNENDNDVGVSSESLNAVSENADSSVSASGSGNEFTKELLEVINRISTNLNSVPEIALSESTEEKRVMKLKRKPMPTRVDEDEIKGKKTAIEALFQAVMMHDKCEIFCRKAEETWFWEKSVSSDKFSTATLWFEKLKLYFRKLLLYLPLLRKIISIESNGKNKVKVILEHPENLTLDIPRELFHDVNDELEPLPGGTENVSTKVFEDVEEINNVMYICKSRLKKLERAMKELVNKLETLLILGSPLGHRYNDRVSIRNRNRLLQRESYDDTVPRITHS